ncbi:c-type cytochrome [Poseidonibacter lekithochrous]|uniref:c-type cytochrome n=1 Tax=Poseidonibacter lekithochrous TaxID=1904463 RepID=UPI0008FCAEFD|nr:c-type cytochrome [Poseidonibacter lekithochrous]QKJ23508.1 cytochrome c553 [Poseidonibacter lekithochrous]
MKKLILLFLILYSSILAREPQEIIDTICSTCHGFTMEKSCFGVSEIPNTLSSSYILESLTAYRAGKKSDYRMGSTMTAETSTLSDDEIKALSIYVKALGKKKSKE